MESLTKNISIVLVVLTIAFGGYYFYLQQDTVPTTDDSSVQDMLASTEVFIGRSQELDRIAFDFTLFEDARFRSLKSFSKPLEEKPVGRSNPFADVGGVE